MSSGLISEAILVNLADPRYFQHGGNLMVCTIEFVLERKKCFNLVLFRSAIQEMMIVVPISVKQPISSALLSAIVFIYVKSVCFYLSIENT